MKTAEQIIILIGLLIGGAIAAQSGIAGGWETYKAFAPLIIVLFIVAKAAISL
jgi:hypothetical protein